MARKKKKNEKTSLKRKEFKNTRHLGVNFTLGKIHFTISIFSIRSIESRMQSLWFTNVKDKNKTKQNREFPGGPAVRTRCFHCSGPGFYP